MTSCENEKWKTGRLQNPTLQVVGFTLLALLTAINPASAQTADAGGEVLEEVLVYGIRGSLRQAVETKRNASSVVDAISAEDIGKFPDINVAESLQRISGVQINRIRGEGADISIRGLPTDFSLVTFNNISMPNALTDGDSARSDTTRSYDYASLPSEFVQVLEVHKTPTASLEEGGLAGTVVVRTPRPFDYDERVLSLSAQGSLESNHDQVGHRITGFYSDKFADDKFGITVGLTTSERNAGAQEYQNWGYQTYSEGGGYFSGPNQFGAFTADGIADPTICDGSLASKALCHGQDWNGNGVEDPGGFVAPFLEFHNIFDETRERNSALLSAQFAATDELEFFADVFYTELEVNRSRSELLTVIFNSLGPFHPAQSETQNVGGRDVVTTYRGDNTDMRPGNRIERRDGDTLSVTLGGEWSRDKWTVEAQISVAESSQVVDAMNIVAASLADISIEANVGDDITTTTFFNDTGQNYLDPSTYRFLGANGELDQEFKDDLDDYKINVTRDMDHGILKSVQAGLHYSERDKLGERAQLFMTVAGLESLYGAQPPSQTWTDVGIPSSSAGFLLRPIEPINGSFLPDYDGGGFQNWLSIDTDSLYGFGYDRLKNAPESRYGINLPLTEDVSEEISNAYVQLNFGNEDGSITGNFGVRYSKTTQISRGAGADLGSISFNPNGGITTVAPLGMIDVEHKYSEWLPSANLRWELNDELVFRLSASETLTRPRLTDISPTTSAEVNTRTISGGNPELDPFTSGNIDVALEWYFGDANLLAVTYFYKDIETLVRTGTNIVTLPVLNVATGESFTQDFVDKSPANADGATIKGLEIAYQQTFDSAPGLLSNTGLIANYTYIDNSDPEAITATSENNYNIGVFYEGERIATRLSYTWRDEFLDKLVVFGNQGSITDEFGTLDLSLSYNINDSFAVVLEGVNLTEELKIKHFTDGLPLIVEDVGRRLFLGLRGEILRH